MANNKIYNILIAFYCCYNLFGRISHIDRTHTIHILYIIYFSAPLLLLASALQRHSSLSMLHVATTTKVEITLVCFLRDFVFYDTSLLHSTEFTVSPAIISVITLASLAAVCIRSISCPTFVATKLFLWYLWVLSIRNVVRRYQLQ